MGFFLFKKHVSKDQSEKINKNVSGLRKSNKNIRNRG